MNKSNHSNHICDICNKEYTNRQNLWRHKRIHYNNINTRISTNLLPTSSNLLQNSSNLLQNSSNKQIKKLNCDNCEKIFSRIDNLKRHKLKCNKNKSDQISSFEIIDMLNNTIKQQSNELKEVKGNL